MSKGPKKIGLLALQGAFLDHIPHLESLGVEYILVKKPQDLDDLDGLIIPGGESTVMARFLREYQLIEPIRQKMSQGLAVWGICAGAILLADSVGQDAGIIGGLAMTVERNAYGRQASSRTLKLDIPLLNQENFPCHFIRAPQIVRHNQQQEVLLGRAEEPYWLRQGPLMATTFHPEMTDSNIFHRYFVEELISS